MLVQTALAHLFPSQRCTCSNECQPTAPTQMPQMPNTKRHKTKFQIPTNASERASCQSVRIWSNHCTCKHTLQHTSIGVVVCPHVDIDPMPNPTLYSNAQMLKGTNTLAIANARILKCPNAQIHSQLQMLEYSNAQMLKGTCDCKCSNAHLQNAQML